MLFPDSGKRDLRDLQGQAAGLRARLPAAATALGRALAEWEADAAGRQGALVLRVKTEELARLRGRLAALAGLVDGLEGMLAEAAHWQRAEAAFAAERGAQPDAALAAWFEARAVPRRARLEAAPVAIDAAGALADMRAALARDAEQRDFDRQLFDLFREAAERTRPFAGGGGAAPIRALADALPTLRERLLAGPRPARDLVLGLRELVAAARALGASPKPPELDECFGLIEGMAAWVEVLRDGEEPGAGQAGGRALDRLERDLRDLSSRYGALAQHWQQQAEGAFRALIDGAARIEAGLLALAKAEQEALTARLERARALFQQHSDPSLSPGLGERIGALLAATPGTPAAFQGWREQCRRAGDDFARAISADSHRLEARCEERAGSIRQRLDALERGPLGAAERSLWAQYGHCLQGLADGPPPTEVIALLGRLQDLGNLDTEAARLAEVVALRRARVQARRAWLAARAGRLARVAAAGPIGGPLTLPPAPPPPGGTDLDQQRRDLVAWRAGLLAAELGLLGRVASLAAHTGERARLRGLLDADLRDALVLPVLRADPRPRFAELARMIDGQTADEAALDAALGTQAARFRVLRAQLQAALGRADGGGWSAPERAAATRLGALLAQPEPDAAPREAVPRWRDQINEAGELLARLEQARLVLERLAAHLGLRLARLRQDCFELDGGAASGAVLAERVWALLQPVRGLVAPPAQRRAQLREADELLAALEQHARRLIAARVEHALGGLAGHPAAAVWRARLAAEPLATPPSALRRELYQLVEAGPPAGDAGRPVGGGAP